MSDSTVIIYESVYILRQLLRNINRERVKVVKIFSYADF